MSRQNNESKESQKKENNIPDYMSVVLQNTDSQTEANNQQWYIPFNAEDYLGTQSRKWHPRHVTS
jgi:hypothetical protein